MPLLHYSQHEWDLPAGVDACDLEYDGEIEHSISDNCGEVADGSIDVFDTNMHVNCFMHLVICNLTRKGQLLLN